MLIKSLETLLQTSDYCTVLCSNLELGEVENEYTSKQLVLFAIFKPKIFTIGRNLTKF